MLVADTNPELRSALADAVRKLGCYCRDVDSSPAALNLLAQDQSLNTLIVDLNLPRLDGFQLIEGARKIRPLGTIAGSILMVDAADEALHRRALQSRISDLLFKPVASDRLRSALARVHHDHKLRSEQPGTDELHGQLAEIAGNVLKLGQKLNRLVERSTREEGDEETVTAISIDRSSLISMVRQMIQGRRVRERFIKDAHFGEPAWDILLDLTLAKLEKTEVSVSSVCIASGVPMSTAMRWINEMVQAGLIERRTDPADGRRNFVSISNATMQSMLRYLGYLYKISPVIPVVSSNGGDGID